MAARDYYHESTDYYQPIQAQDVHRGRGRDRGLAPPDTQWHRSRSGSRSVHSPSRGILHRHRASSQPVRRESRSRHHNHIHSGVGAPLLGALAGGVTGHKIDGALGAALGAAVGVASVRAVEKIAETTRDADDPRYGGRHHRHHHHHHGHRPARGAALVRDADYDNRHERHHRHSVTVTRSPRTSFSSHVENIRNRLLAPAPPAAADRHHNLFAPTAVRSSSTHAYAPAYRNRGRRRSVDSVSTWSDD